MEEKRNSVSVLQIFEFVAVVFLVFGVLISVFPTSPEGAYRIIGSLSLLLGASIFLSIPTFLVWTIVRIAVAELFKVVALRPMRRFGASKRSAVRNGMPIDVESTSPDTAAPKGGIDGPY